MFFKKVENFYLKVHCGPNPSVDVLNLALENKVNYFGRGVVRCNSEELFNGFVSVLNDLGYPHTRLSDEEAESLMSIPDNFLKIFLVNWYEKEKRAWANYKRGGYG
tara:strand:- start:13435 stop:13752 length:318 start_codon:yes stop_codon:yes gene_type:complete